MNLDNDTHVAWVKIVLTWLGAGFSAITLSRVSAFLVIVFTLLQIEKQLRERRREKRLEALAEKLRAPDTTS